MTVAYLRWPLVVYVGDTAPMGLQYDTVMPNAVNPVVGKVYEGGAFVAPPANSEAANLAALRNQATQAFLDNRAFLNIASPSNAQTLAQVKALTRQMNKVMRLVLGEFDGTD